MHTLTAGVSGVGSRCVKTVNLGFPLICAAEIEGMVKCVCARARVCVEERNLCFVSVIDISGNQQKSPSLLS